MQISASSKIIVTIKQNSLRARMAAFNLKAPSVAMVWGHTILLFGTTAADFLADKKWVCHELRHVWQVQKFGKIGFLYRYVVLSFRFGYHHHPFEVDARLHDTDETMLQKIEFVIK